MIAPSRAEQLAEAAAARDEGMAQGEQAADPRVILMIDDAIQRAIDSGRRFSANDIRDHLPASAGHLVGNRVNSFVNRRCDGRPLMVRVGYEPSSLKSTHAHDIKIWQGYAAHQVAIGRSGLTAAAS